MIKVSILSPDKRLTADSSGGCLEGDFAYLVSYGLRVHFQILHPEEDGARVLLPSLDRCHYLCCHRLCLQLLSFPRLTLGKWTSGNILYEMDQMTYD